MAPVGWRWGELDRDWVLKPWPVSLSASASNGSSQWVCVVMDILIYRKSKLGVD